MKIQKKEIMMCSQNKTYSDPSLWHISTPVSPSDRLYCVLRYIKILKLFGVFKEDNFEQKIKILEPGCGIGSFSVILSVFGEILSFDYSTVAIETAKRLFGNYVIFFEADGSEPANIPVLSNKKFDFILLKEFHPFTRNIANSPKPVYIVRDYYNMLNNGGLIILEHNQPFSNWKKSNDILQTSEIIKQFRAKVFNTYSLDLILPLRIIFKHERLNILLLKLLNPIMVLYCSLKNCNIPKTIIIKKDD